MGASLSCVEFSNWRFRRPHSSVDTTSWWPPHHLTAIMFVSATIIIMHDKMAASFFGGDSHFSFLDNKPSEIGVKAKKKTASADCALVEVVEMKAGLEDTEG